MSKVATYLQEHILGEVSTNPAILAAMSHDLSVLEITPEMVAYPRVTSDIRKIARFAWQLAEKGHVLPLTPRGGGTDETGGAIGKGIIVSMPAHMDKILEFDVKQKLVRLQPGVMNSTLAAALSMHGMGIPVLPTSSAYSTIGGTIAKNLTGRLGGRYGDLSGWVSQLEVVLANGDVLQTERLSKRDLNKKKGLQTFEGEIYRSLDNLIEDNAQLINDKLMSDVPDNAGYTALSKVKRKDGSFDLTPLFVGSQGTLGIISEMIMRADFVGTATSVAAAAFSDLSAARDAIDELFKVEPSFIELYDGELFAVAESRGKKYDFIKNAGGKVGAVVVVGFDDFNERHRARKLKKFQKAFTKTDIYIEGGEGEEFEGLMALREVTALSVVPEGRGVSAPPIIDGAFVPGERMEEFLTSVKNLAKRHDIVMPLHGRIMDGTFYARPMLQLHKVGDKQKVFKLLDEYTTLVDHLGGHIISNGSEGRVKARFAYKSLEPEVLTLFEAVKAIFDPQGILNQGVKQTSEVRHLVSQLRSDYNTASISNFVPYV